MKNPFEGEHERIPTKNEVMEVMSRIAENATFVRELSDNQGLYLLEVKIDGKEPGETIEYQYMRKGRFGKNQSSDTSVSATYYQDEIPISGEMIVVYNPETNQWKDLR
ncbi:MAG: hypothetical protein V4439_02820 [Patescibacteria group bacterium]